MNGVTPHRRLQFSLPKLMLWMAVFATCLSAVCLLRMSLPADPTRLETMIGILITLLALMACVATFAILGLFLSKRHIFVLGTAGCIGGFVLALLSVYLSSPYGYQSPPWELVGYEYLKYDELRIPCGVIAPITFLGGLLGLGCRKLFGV